MKNYFLTYFWLFICSLSLLSAQAQSGNACGFNETGPGATLQDVQISIASIAGLCDNAGFTALPSIAITEIAEGERAINGDNTNSLVLVFELPEGLEFKKAGNNIKVSTSGGITFQSINVQSSAIFVFLSGASPTQTDAITLSGVELRPVGAIAGDYFVSVGTAIGCVNGIAPEGSTLAGQIKVIAAPSMPGTTFNTGPHFCLGDVIPPGFLTVSSASNLRYYADEALNNELIPVADPTHPTAAELLFNTSAPGTQLAYVQAESAEGCKSKVVKIAIEVKDEPTLDVSQVDGTICPGEKIEIDLRDYSNGSLSWTNNNTAIGLGASGGDLVYFTAAENNTSASVEAIVELTAVLNGCVVTDQIHFNLLPGPSIGAFSPPIDICNISGDIDLKQDARFKLEIKNGGLVANGNFTYSGKGVIDGSGIFNASSQSWRDNELVDITVNYTREDGCATTRTLTLIKMVSNPMVSIASPLGGADACKLEAVELKVETNDQTSGLSLQTTGSGSFSGTFDSDSLMNTFYYTPGSTDTGAVTLTATTNNPGDPCTIDTDAITINIYEPIVVQQATISFCPAEKMAELAFTSNIAGGVFDWQVADPALLGLSSSTGTGSIINITAAANTTGNNKTTKVTVTQTVNGCTSKPMNFEVVVKPQPVATAIGALAFCPGDPVSIKLSSTPSAAATVFNWTSSNAAVGLSHTSGTGNNISFTATNTGTAPISTTISYTATLDGCISATESFVLEVMPSPQVALHTDIEVCSGRQVVSALSSTVEGASFSWAIDDPILGMPASGEGDLNFTSLVHYGTADSVRTVRVKATKDNCTGPEQTIKIILKPLPKIFQQQDVIIFPDENVASIGFTDNSNGQSIFSWTATNATAIGLPANSGTGALPAFIAGENNTGNSILATITVHANWNGCASDVPMKFIIELSPQPEIVEVSDKVACPEELVEVTFTSDVSGTSFNWANGNTAIGLAATGEGDISFTTALNNSTSDVGATIEVTPISPEGVEGNPATFTITLKPAPVVAAQNDIELCPGENLSFVGFTSETMPGEGIFKWEVGNKDLLGLASSTGTDSIKNITAGPNTTGSNLPTTVKVTQTVDGCTGQAMVFNVIVKPQPVPETVNDLTICPGEQVNISLLANTDQATTTFSWQSSNPAIGLVSSGSGDISFTAAQNADAGDITSMITFTASRGGCKSIEDTFNISIKQQPVVIQPANVIICSGDLARTEFSSSMEGASFSWTIDNPGFGMPASGSGNLNFSTEAFYGTAEEVRTVKVKATRNGCVSEEKQFSLILKPRPQLVQQADVEIFPGQDIAAILFGDNSNGESTIAWTASNASLIGLSANNGTDSLPAFTANDNTSGGTIESSVIVDAIWDGCTATSMKFTLKLRPRPIMSAEDDVVACPGGNIALTFDSNVSGTTFHWTNSNTGIGLGASDSGNISFVAAENVSGQIIEAAIKVTPVAPSGFAGEPVEFKITLNPLPQTASISDIAICPGENTGVDFTANTTGETFYWQNSNTSIGLAAAGEGDFSFTGASNISGSDITATITYYASRKSCKSEAKTFIITLKNKPVPNAMAPSDICPGEAFTPPAFTDDTNGKSTFYWTIDEPALLGLQEASGSGNLPVFQPAENFSGAAIPVVIKYHSTLNGCASDTSAYHVSLLPRPVLLNTDMLVCANEALKIELGANTAGGETYTWTNSNTAIGLAAGSGSGGTIEFTALNKSDTDQSATISVSITKGGCTYAAQSFNIVVKPLPAVNNPSAELLQQLCSGEAVVFDPTSNLGQVSFSWTASSDTELENFVESGTGTINEKVLNNTSQTARVVYTIQPLRKDSIECSGAAVELLVYIAPVPDLVLPQASYSICNSETLTIAPSSATSIPDTYYEWSVLPNELGVVGGSGNEITQAFHNKNNEADTITYSIRAVAGNCSSEAQTVKVYIRPFATVDAGADFTVCEEDQIVLQATIGGSASFGEWQGGLGSFQNALASTTTYLPAPSEIGSSVQFVITTNDPSGPCATVSDTVNVMIEPLPELAIINLPSVYCTQNDPFLLQGNPANGTFSGVGVVYNEKENRYYFDPAVSGIGLYRISYSYQSANGCTGTDSGLIDVSSGANPDFNILSTNENICETQARIGLTPLIKGGLFEGPGVEIIGGNAWFNPAQARVGENIISYTITDLESGCTTSSSQTVWVNAKPDIAINYQNECAGNSVRFHANIHSISENDTIISYQWSFGDGFSSVEEAPVRQYSSPGVYDVTLKLQTALSCDVTEIRQNVVVSNIVGLDFDFENICGNDTTLFIPKNVGEILNYSNPSFVALEYSWDFGDPASGAGNLSNEATTRHKFSGFGEYEVTLMVRSNLGCEETVSQKIHIVPAITSFPHVQQFEGSENSTGWFTEGDNSSWQYGIPEGELINKPAVAGTNVWATGLAGGSGYQNNERSYVISPCFDLKDIEQPMISMNLFLHTETGRDGVVLQYSKDGGRSWATLGNLGKGLNWYNTNNIVADPAEKGIGNEGWSGTSTSWKEVAYSLDDLNNTAGSVIFRISFASDATNVGEFTFEGLALDDVYVGSRNKKVLVENFTNTNAAGFAENVAVFSGLAIDPGLAQDIVLLQYHTPFPQKDSIYMRNPDDHSSRSFFYGISQAPATIIDGVQYNWLDRTVMNRQALSKPGASININIAEKANTSILKGAVNVSPLGQVAQGLILYINAVETESKSGDIVFRNVVKKILPEPSGIYLDSLEKDQVFGFEWSIPKDFPAGTLGVVAYLQERDSKKVLQSSFMPVNVPMKGGWLTSIGDMDFAVGRLKVFPNPVKDRIKLKAGSLLRQGLKYELLSLSGTILQKGTLPAGKMEHEILCPGLIDGMYILRVFTASSEPVSFKIMVMAGK